MSIQRVKMTEDNKKQKNQENQKYEAIIVYETASTPTDQLNRMYGYKEEEIFNTLKEAKKFIKDQIWQVDDLKNNGRELHDGRKEYGYWSKTKDRQTGKQWYEWATVKIRAVEHEDLEVNEVLK